MVYMFAGTRAFNQPIGAWNTTKVADMTEMFADASALNQPIGKWDTAEVRWIRMMFQHVLAFNQPIGDWNTNNVLTDPGEHGFLGMFEGASAFNQKLCWNAAQADVFNAIFPTKRDSYPTMLGAFA